MRQKEAVCLVPALDHGNHFRPVLRSFFQPQVIPDASLQPSVYEALLQLQTTEAQNKAFGIQGQTIFLKAIQHWKNLSVDIR